MKTCLVIGGRGFLGRHLVPRLQTAGWKVVVAGRSAVGKDLTAGIEYHQVDITRADAVEQLIALTEPDGVVNLAGRTRGTAEELFETNQQGVVYLLSAIKYSTPHASVVLIGSAAEYGNVPSANMPIVETTPCTPVSDYGSSKLASTLNALDLGRTWNMRVSVLRTFNMVGEGTPESFVVGALVARIRRAVRTGDTTPIPVGRTDTTRDFVAVTDVADAIVRLLDRNGGPEVFNICSGQPVSIEQLLSSLTKIAGVPVTWQQDPALVRATDPLVSYGSYERLKREIGFTPQVSLDDSLSAAWRATG